MRRAFAGALLALALGVTAPSCAPSTSQPLRVGLAVFPSYELFFLARKHGWLGDDIDLVEFQSPGDPMRAFREGAIDVVALTTLYALDLAQRLPDTRIVMPLDHSIGADAILAGPAVPDVKALKGRRVGVHPTLLGPYLLRRALDKAGLSKDDLTIVPVMGGDQQGDQERVLAGNEVDALVTEEPVATRLVGRGAHTIFTSADIPGEIVDVLLVRLSLLERERPRLQRIVDAWYRARDAFRADPAGSAAIMAPRESLTPAEFVASFRGLDMPDRPAAQKLLDGSDPTLLRALRTEAAIMREEGWLVGPVDPQRLPDASLVTPSGR